MISAKRIRLRALERSDLAFFVEWLNDPDVLEGLSIYLPISRYGEEQWFELTMKNPAEEHPLVIEVKNEEQWLVIGDISLRDINWRNRSAELGMMIGDKRYWDHGYGTEALNLFLQHCFETLNLERISLRVFENNLRAIHVYQKCGFTQEGILRKAEYHHGQYLAVIIMAILKSEWELRKNKTL
ncbi:MAG: GNAT family N-acetyltransferase [Anaerolineales bacterium]